MIFVDESGSITRSIKPKYRYFVISMIETEEPYTVRRVFRKSKKNFIEKHPSLKMDYSREIKGSCMSVQMKKFIIRQLLEKTDIKFHYIIIDNFHLNDRFHDNVELCFNFIIGNFLKRFLPKEYNDKYNLKMTLDERNCTVPSLNSLKDYLKIEVCLKNNIIGDVSQCSYADSKEKDVLQVADIFANLVHRSCLAESKGLGSSDGNCRLLKDINNNDNMYFPYRHNGLSFFKNDVYTY
ncbi:DUF3800 domain-containing protein [Companilactobacillus zhachilii]|uniref:DUF3800 domain-containing protein n=1 Tax=Companilactobacillus zhachilii TaxID=2304606 RepID=A0A386PR54_9LACO|nr:DUF3800 domain-containing protein [Companilactobacillus zhachilii]AYE38374.1 DUF3800 domain-containing protein [Companilactobacillus zhachilii]